MIDSPLNLLKAVTARLSEEVTPPDIFPADAVLYADHPNILQLEHIAKAVVVMTRDHRTIDEVMTTLKCAEDVVTRHITDCEMCVQSLMRFINLYPTRVEIQTAEPL